MLKRVFELQLQGMVDSSVETTRTFWRKKYFDASDAEALDPRPFAEVLASRLALSQDSKVQA